MSHSNTTNVGHGSTVGGIQTGGGGNVQHINQALTVAERAQVFGLVGGLVGTLDKTDGVKTELRSQFGSAILRGGGTR